MTDVRKVPLPRTPAGPVTWEALAPYLELTFREILARFDARNPQSDFAGAFLAYPDGSATIGVESKVADQRTLPIVNAGNRLSAQSVNPLSSTGTGSTAEIVVAAHTVQYGFGTVSYNGGTITGLDPLTTYYVYAEDPDYEGGAVSYTVTENQQAVVSSNGRYLVGTITTSDSPTPATGTPGGGWGDWQYNIP